MVEGECLVQAGEAVVGLSLVQVAVSEAFLGAGFVQGCVQGSGDVEGVLMVGAGFGRCAGGEQQPAQIVQGFRFAVAVADLAEQRQRPLQRGPRSRVVPAQHLYPLRAARSGLKIVLVAR